MSRGENRGRIITPRARIANEVRAASLAGSLLKPGRRRTIGTPGEGDSELAPDPGAGRITGIGDARRGTWSKTESSKSRPVTLPIPAWRTFGPASRFPDPCPPRNRVQPRSEAGVAATLQAEVAVENPVPAYLAAGHHPGLKPLVLAEPVEGGGDREELVVRGQRTAGPRVPGRRRSSCCEV